MNRIEAQYKDGSAIPAIELLNCSKHFGAVKALNAINLAVSAGERLVVMGQSGAGKSTLLRLITGLDACDSGSVLLHGKDAARTKPADRQLAMVTQDYALYPQLTVRKNILAGVAKQKLSRTDSQTHVLRLMQEFDVADLAERKPSQLSGGQRQRTCFAKALATKPKILLLDEPLSQQDPELAQRARDLINSITSQHNLTTVLITHNPLDAMQMADRLLLLDQGKVLQCDLPEAVYHHPTSQTALRLLTPFGVNSIPASLTLQADSPFHWTGKPLSEADRISFRIEQAEAISQDAPPATPQKQGLTISFHEPSSCFTPSGPLLSESLGGYSIRVLNRLDLPSISQFFVSQNACLITRDQ